MANTEPLSDLQPGHEVDRTVVCTSVHHVTGRPGRRFVVGYLRDSTGAMRGVALEHADAAAAVLASGVPVQVRGPVERYAGRRRIRIDSVAPATAAEIAAAELIRVSGRDLGELDGFLDHLAGEVRSPGYRSLLAAFLDDRRYRAELRRSPCTAYGHHAWIGGLLEHTVAVAHLAHEACAVQSRLDQDLLLTAAILHDAGHTLGFTLGAMIEPSVSGQLLGHLAIGQRLIDERAARVPTLGRSQLDALTHCILRHHDLGDRPVPEAAALHHINALEVAASSPAPRLAALPLKATGGVGPQRA